MTDSEPGVRHHLSQMNKILRQIFPLIPERNRIHHFNPWIDKSSSPSYSSFSRFPAALPFYQQHQNYHHQQNQQSGNNGHARFFRDPLPSEPELIPGLRPGQETRGAEFARKGLIIPNSDPGDEVDNNNVDGFIDVLQVASDERGLERMEQSRIPSEEEVSSNFDLNKVSVEGEEGSQSEVPVGDRPRSMTSSGGHHGFGPYGRKPEPAALGKRGPECMRRCIAQGVLHPVQCHSLC